MTQQYQLLVIIKDLASNDLRSYAGSEDDFAQGKYQEQGITYSAGSLFYKEQVIGRFPKIMDDGLEVSVKVESHSTDKVKTSNNRGAYCSNCRHFNRELGINWLNAVQYDPEVAEGKGNKALIGVLASESKSPVITDKNVGTCIKSESIVAQEIHGCDQFAWKPEFSLTKRIYMRLLDTYHRPKAHLVDGKMVIEL